VELLVHGLQPGGVDVRVDLRGGYAGMAQHLLHLTQVGTAVEHVGGEAVPHGVRADVGRHALTQAVLLQQFPNPLPTQPPTTVGEKRPGRLGGHSGGQLRAFVIEVVAYRLGRPNAQRYQPLLVALAAAEAETLVQMHVGQTQV